MAHIDEVAHRHIVVDGQAFKEDIVLTQWGWVESRTEKGKVTLRELELLLLHHHAKVFVFGRGLIGIHNLSPEDEKAIERMGVKMHSLPTPEAAELFNRLADEEDGVIGLFRVLV